MKCPHCENTDDPSMFFQSKDPIMEQGYQDVYMEKKWLYACPECGKAFIIV
jgi:predicted RNA-binding Zn-ribbon protein involved in translation (DUF1610 family)